MNAPDFSFHWFDLIVVGVLIVGTLRGRKNGMSAELILLIQWLAIIFVAAFGYRPFGLFIQQTSGISQLYSFLVSYTTCIIVVCIVFALIRRSTGGKLAGSDVFGTGEYYLGMGSGAVRFACMTLVFMALLNSILYTPQELAQKEKDREYNWGSIRFPTPDVVQEAVLKKSFIGRSVKQYADFMLIEPSTSEKLQFKQKEFALP